MYYSSILHRVIKCIRMVWVKLLVCPHKGEGVLGVGQVDDVVRPAGDHVDSFDFVAR